MLSDAIFFEKSGSYIAKQLGIDIEYLGLQLLVVLETGFSRCV